MDIKWIETSAPDGEYTQDMNQSKLIVQVDRDVEIVVLGYGCGEARLTVRGMHGQELWLAEESYRMQAIWAMIAKAIVWASPTTIAHLVMDTINNQ